MTDNARRTGPAVEAHFQFRCGWCLRSRNSKKTGRHVGGVCEGAPLQPPVPFPSKGGLYGPGRVVGHPGLREFPDNGQHGTNELIYLVGLHVLVSTTLNGFNVPVPERE